MVGRNGALGWLPRPDAVAAGWGRWLTVVVVRGVRWWGVVSSAVALVLLVGGWTVAAGLQPGSFDAVSSTISSLAARGAADRWVMTLALAGAGACYVVTGLALWRPRCPGGCRLPGAGALAARGDDAGALGACRVAARCLRRRRGCPGWLARLVRRGADGRWQVGLAERILAGAQAAWPLALVLACRRSQSRARRRRATAAGAGIPG